jgi:hypothetical protein
MKFTLLLVIPTQRDIQRIVLSTTWSEPVAEPEELLLVDALQHGGGRPLDYLVFQGGHREWALSAFGMYVRRDGSARYAPRWTREVRSVRFRSRSAS